MGVVWEEKIVKANGDITQGSAKQRTAGHYVTGMHTFTKFCLPIELMRLN
jgi:hypothetical protein